MLHARDFNHRICRRVDDRNRWSHAAAQQRTLPTDFRCARWVFSFFLTEFLLCFRADADIKQPVKNVAMSFVRNTQFLPTARRINQFSSNRTPKPEDKVVRARSPSRACSQTNRCCVDARCILMARGTCSTPDTSTSCARRARKATSSLVRARVQLCRH